MQCRFSPNGSPDAVAATVSADTPSATLLVTT